MSRPTKLAAFRVERRSVAAAVFYGTHLEYADVKQLDSDHEKAAASTVEFVNWIVSSFDIGSAAVDNFENEQDTLRAELHQALEQTLRSTEAALNEVEKSELLAAFGHPALKSCKDVRQVVTTIWPILEAKRQSGIGTKLDAVALGLYFQTERLFEN